MKKRTESKDNHNFYHLKELQWKNKSNLRLFDKNNIQNIDSINYLKENSWNKRFIYDKIQNYDSAKDKNVLANILNLDKMNCYHNAIKKNDIIVKTFYSKTRRKKIFGDEYNKTNLKIILNPMGRNCRKARIIKKSSSTNKFITSKIINFDSFEKENELNKLINNNTIIPEKLTKIWKYLSVGKKFQDSFNIILSNLSEQMQKELCEREYNELYELRNDLQLLSTSVYYRSYILDGIHFLNEKLGINLRTRLTNSSEVLLKKISNKIKDLREHTINICFLMKKIKSKINGIHQWGKFELDSICEKFKFDKNYLIKMREEMHVLNEGYTKYFFDIGDENNPFLLNISELGDNKNNKEPYNFFHIVPLSEEMKNAINQSLYIIYQELIAYQNTSGEENNFKSISPIKKYKYSDNDIKIYKSTNEKFNKNFKNILDNNLCSSSSVSTIKTFYNTDKYILSNFMLSGNSTENNNKYPTNIKNSPTDNKKDNKEFSNEIIDSKIKFDINDKNYSLNDIKRMNRNNILIKNIKKCDGNNLNIVNNEEKEINDINDNENNNNNENNNEEENEIENKNNQIENLNDEKIKLNNEEILNKSNKEGKEEKDLDNNFEEKSEKKENLEIDNDIKKSKSSTINEPKKSKDIKVIIFRDDLTIFSKDFYPYYFSSIPQEIKNMFKIYPDIIHHMTQGGVSPYMLIVYKDENENQSESQEIDDINWEKIKNYILGLCIFSYQFNDNLLKLTINHISNSIPQNQDEEENNTNAIIDSLKKVFNEVIDYIKQNFYFDEIILEYNSSKKNEQILKFFLNDLHFVINNASDNEIIESKENGDNNNTYNKMIYTNDSSKNRVDVLIRESILGYLNKNLFDIFDSMLITNNEQISNSEMKNKNESYLINNILMGYLLEKNEKTNINKIYNKITNLSQLIEVFKSNNINKKQIPLSLAENRFDIISSTINKTSINNHFNNSIFFNNGSLNSPSSYYDNNSGIYYNFIKGDKVLLIENENYHMKMYHLIYKNFGLFFCKVSEELKEHLSKDNIYIQINSLYKELISSNKIQVLENKILWIPCFEINKNIEAINDNSVGTFHEYIKISNKIIRKINREPLLVNNGSKTKESKQFKIAPNLINDIIIDNDFIFAIVNNSEMLYDKLVNEEKNQDNNDKEEPYIIFISSIKKSDFIE